MPRTMQNIPHGHFIGRATLPFPCAIVSAGALTLPLWVNPNPPEPKLAIKFLLTGDWLQDVGAKPGDVLNIDTKPLAYRSKAGFDGDLVVVLTKYGLIVGWYRYSPCGDSCIDLADGSDEFVRETPDMRIMGIVMHLMKTPVWGKDGQEFR